MVLLLAPSCSRDGGLEPSIIPEDKRDLAKTYAHVPTFLRGIPELRTVARSQARVPIPDAPGWSFEGVLVRGRPAFAVGISRNGQIRALVADTLNFIPAGRTGWLAFSAVRSDAVTVVAIELEELGLILNVEEALPRGWCAGRDEAVEWWSIDSDLAEGVHDCQFPNRWEVLPELPVLFYPGATTYGVMRIRPQLGDVEVSFLSHRDFLGSDQEPQSLRVVHDLLSGRLVGDGPRHRPFVLDSFNRRVERWLVP